MLKQAKSKDGSGSQKFYATFTGIIKYLNEFHLD